MDIRSENEFIEVLFVSVVFMLSGQVKSTTPVSWSEIRHLQLLSRVILFFSGTSLKTEFRTTPVTPLRVIFDRIVCAQTNPLWERTILSHLFRESALCAKCLLGWL